VFSQKGEMMLEKKCPLLLAFKTKDDSKESALCIEDNCAWWYFKASTATGAEISGKCCFKQIAESLR